MAFWIVAFLNKMSSFGTFEQLLRALVISLFASMIIGYAYEWSQNRTKKQDRDELVEDLLGDLLGTVIGLISYSLLWWFLW